MVPYCTVSEMRRVIGRGDRRPDCRSDSCSDDRLVYTLQATSLTCLITGDRRGDCCRDNRYDYRSDRLRRRSPRVYTMLLAKHCVFILPLAYY